MGRRLLASSGAPASSRRPSLERGQASGVPVPCSHTDDPLKTGRASPVLPPAGLLRAALTLTTRPPPFSSWAQRRPGRSRLQPLFRDPFRSSRGPAPFLLPSRCSSGCLPHSPRGRGGEDERISPRRTKVSDEPSRHFLLATAPERWAGTLLPRYHRDRYGGGRIPRVPRFAHGPRRTGAAVGSASRPGGPGAPCRRRAGGKAAEPRSGPVAASAAFPPSLQVQRWLSASPRTWSTAPARQVSVQSALGRR